MLRAPCTQLRARSKRSGRQADRIQEPHERRCAREDRDEDGVGWIHRSSKSRRVCCDAIANSFTQTNYDTVNFSSNATVSAAEPDRAAYSSCGPPSYAEPGVPLNVQTTFSGKFLDGVVTQSLELEWRGNCTFASGEVYCNSPDVDGSLPIDALCS
jgi:hypothetical protein